MCSKLYRWIFHYCNICFYMHYLQLYVLLVIYEYTINLVQSFLIIVGPFNWESKVTVERQKIWYVHLWNIAAMTPVLRRLPRYYILYVKIAFMRVQTPVNMTALLFNVNICLHANTNTCQYDCFVVQVLIQVNPN